MLSLIKRIFRSLGKFLGLSLSISYNLIRVDSLPNKLKDEIIYIEGDWTAAFVCPCGCKQTIELNLVDDVRPVWKVGNDTSISPSIWKRDGCKSHFFIKKGKVIWA